jgi:hypothetical protein
MRVRVSIAVVFWASTSACNASVKPDRVPECERYEAALSACFHRDASVASQPALQPKDEADRDRIRDLCVKNLERLPASCK